MKIVVLDGYTLSPGDIGWGELEKIAEIEVFDRTNREDILSRIGNAEIVLTNKTPITKETLDRANIKYIGVLATGFNVVDTEAAKAKGIPVCNVPTYGTDAVAQYAMALLLEVCHHIQRHSDRVKEGAWNECPDFCFWDYPLIELKGKNFGIIGYGRIGRATGEIAKAFGMNILAYDEYQNKEYECENMKYVSLDELLANSNVISLHCPLTKDNEGIISKDNLAKMKDGVIILNTSRGQLVNEEDLSDSLNSGKVAYAAVDVVKSEPIAKDNPLLKAKNILITPHIAWAPIESRQRLMDVAVDNVRAFLAGKPQNIVNK